MKNAELQKEWANQQMRERKAAQEAEAEEEANYAAQSEAILRMRGMLEDENAQRKAQYAKQMQEENKRLAREKRERDEAWKNNNNAANIAETTLTKHPEALQADGTIARNMFAEDAQ